MESRVFSITRDVLKDTAVYIILWVFRFCLEDVVLRLPIYDRKGGMGWSLGRYLSKRKRKKREEKQGYLLCIRYCDLKKIFIYFTQNFISSSTLSRMRKLELG